MRGSRSENKAIRQGWLILICRVGSGAQALKRANRFMLNRSTQKSPRVAVLFLFILGCTAVTGSAARNEEFVGESGKWRCYQSPNFELFSAAREEKSRELLYQLELLRALFFDMFKLKECLPLPVTVYYFGSEKDFKAYAPESQRQALGGYYLYRPDRAVMAISPVWSPEFPLHVVFHEYIHHLNRAIGLTPPLWYNEGVAELFSTIEFKANGVILGKHLPWHVDSLRAKKWLSLETLFAVRPDFPIYNSGRHTGQFFAESWVLLHYLRYGETDLAQEKIERFLHHVMQATPEEDPVSRRQNFQDMLGLDYPEMERRLKEYSRRGTFYSYQAKSPPIPERTSYTQRLMPKNEIRVSLAELSLRVNQSPHARLCLLEAVEKDPGHPRYWETLGSDAWYSEDFDVAQERWQKALDAGSTNPAVFHELGQREGRRWFANFDINFRLPAERAQKLRALLHHSIACAPGQFEAYEMLAWVEASVVEPDTANLSLVEHHLASLRQQARTLLALALAQVRLNDRDAAIRLLDRLDQMNPDYGVASATEMIRAKLEGREPRKISPPLALPAPNQRLRMELPEVPR